MPPQGGPDDMPMEDDPLAAMGAGGTGSPDIEALLQAILGSGQDIDPETLQMILQMLQQGGEAVPGGVL